jgi:hypothetical protein
LGDIPDLEKILDPCIRVIRTESYGKVLSKITDLKREKGKGVSLYELAKEEVLKSTSGLVNALKLLTECGYAVYVERGARKRRDYYLTPLGIAVDALLKLYKPEEIGIEYFPHEDEIEQIIYYDVACYYVSNLFLRYMPIIFALTQPLYIYEDEAGNIHYVETDEETLVKGFKTAQYLAMLICMKGYRPYIYPLTPKNFYEAVALLHSVGRRVGRQAWKLIRAVRAKDTAGMKKAAKIPIYLLLEHSYRSDKYVEKVLTHLSYTYEKMILLLDKLYRITTPLDQTEWREYKRKMEELAREWEKELEGIVEEGEAGESNDQASCTADQSCP